MRRRVLLIAATTGYQVREFATAAQSLGLDLVLATDRCHVLANPWGDDAIPVRFQDPSRVAIAAGLDALAERGPFDGVAGVGDRPAFVAAQIAQRIGLRFSPADAVLAASNKYLSRQRLHAAGVQVPDHRLVPLACDPRTAAASAHYPCVLKPLALSASRGVIRANDPDEFVAAFTRIKKLLEREKRDEDSLQVEHFIPGREFALEGLLSAGRLQVLALFDKPDPLDGPFFEETIYVTPSRESAAVQESIFDATQRAVSALGLTHGPVHAEMRVNREGVWILEVAGRPIGGLCSRVLRFDPDITLEQAILRHAIGDDVTGLRLAPGAHGVMMIPIPRGGMYEGVEGTDEARGVETIEDIQITAKQGQILKPLPEGASYLGFIFSRADSPGVAEQALRQSASRLKFHFSSVLSILK
jgi:biotin carboxylase